MGMINKYITMGLALMLVAGVGTPTANVSARSPQIAASSSAVTPQSVLVLKEDLVGGSLYGKPNKSTWRYRSLVLELGGKQKAVDWQPLIDGVSSFAADLDGNKRKEWILQLTLNSGTGIVDNEARILRTDLSEIPIENPKKAANEALVSSMNQSDGKVTYTVTVAGENRVFTYNEQDAGWWFDGATAGNIVHYTMEHGRLTARLGTQVSPGLFIGTTKVYYEYRDGRLRISDIAFTTNL